MCFHLTGVYMKRGEGKFNCRMYWYPFNSFDSLIVTIHDN